MQGYGWVRHRWKYGRLTVFDRELFRTKMMTVIRLLLRDGNRTAKRTAQNVHRYLFIFEDREPYRSDFGNIPYDSRS